MEVVRKDIVEAVHLVHAVALDERGHTVAIYGDPNWLTYWRSTAKPFQALGAVITGAAETFGLTPEELAIACGSHSGSRKHITVVQKMLAKAGLREEDLGCGVHDPFDPDERLRLLREGRKPSRLHSNCSGKHAAMLLTAKQLGAPLKTYCDPAHPVQRLIVRVLMEATDDETLPDTVTSDGCGAPVWASSLSSIALSFHRFVSGSFLYGTEAQRLVGAMGRHPEMVACEGNWNTRLIQATKGRFIGKGGAEGLFAGAFRDGRAIAVKVQDGSHRATPLATVALLTHLDWLTKAEQSALSDYFNPPLKNLHNQVVGTIRVKL